MNLGGYEMITDRINPQTTWGHEDANRIGGAINWLNSVTSRRLYLTSSVVGYYVPSGSDRVYFSLTVGGNTYTEDIPATDGATGWLLDSPPYVTVMLDETANGLRISVVCPQGIKGWLTIFYHSPEEALAKTDWQEGQFVTWAEIQSDLFAPWLDTIEAYGVRESTGLSWDKWQQLVGYDDRGREVPTSATFGVAEANALERGLELAYMTHTNGAPLYTGAAYTGGFIGG